MATGEIVLPTHEINTFLGRSATGIFKLDADIVKDRPRIWKTLSNVGKQEPHTVIKGDDRLPAIHVVNLEVRSHDDENIDTSARFNETYNGYIESRKRSKMIKRYSYGPGLMNSSFPELFPTPTRGSTTERALRPDLSVSSSQEFPKVDKSERREVFFDLRRSKTFSNISKRKQSTRVSHNPIQVWRQTSNVLKINGMKMSKRHNVLSDTRTFVD